jgi:hypothetical protein
MSKQFPEFTSFFRKVDLMNRSDCRQRMAC